MLRKTISRLSRLFVFVSLSCATTAALHAQSGSPITSVAITFSGNSRVSSEELTEDFKRCSGESWKKIDQRLHEYFAQKCSRSLMFSKGFWRAQILDVKSHVENDVYVVQINLGEGPRYRFGKLTIEGNQALSDKQILDLLKQRKGDVADGSAFKDFVFEKLKRAYDEQGFVQYNAEFDPTFHDPLDWKDDGVVDVELTIDEGHRFTLRRIKFAGVDDQIGESLIGEFTLKSGEMFSNRRFIEAIDKLNELDRFERVDRDLDVRIITDEKAGGVDLVITLRPRSQ